MRIEIRNPRWLADNRIDCEIDLGPGIGWVDYTAAPDDVALFGRLVYDACVKDGPAPYVPPPPELIEEQAKARVRSEIEYILQRVIYPVSTNPLLWDDLSDGDKSDIRAYHSAVKAVEKQPGFPSNIQWPSVPGVLK